MPTDVNKVLKTKYKCLKTKVFVWLAVNCYHKRPT